MLQNGSLKTITTSNYNVLMRFFTVA